MEVQQTSKPSETVETQQISNTLETVKTQQISNPLETVRTQEISNPSETVKNAADLQPLRDSQDAADLQPLGDSQDTADLQPPNGDATNLQPLGDSQDAADLQPLTTYLCTATPTSIYTDPTHTAQLYQSYYLFVCLITSHLLLYTLLYTATPQISLSYLHQLGPSHQAFGELAECLDAADVTIANSDQLLALLRCLSHLNSHQALLKAVSAYYSDHGIDPPNDDERVLHKGEMEHAEALVAGADLDNKDLASGRATHHWLMDQEPSTVLTTTLTRYPPGSMLLDRSDHYWIRRATMVVTRHPS